MFTVTSRIICIKLRFLAHYSFINILFFPRDTLWLIEGSPNCTIETFLSKLLSSIVSLSLIGYGENLHYYPIPFVLKLWNRDPFNAPYRDLEFVYLSADLSRSRLWRETFSKCFDFFVDNECLCVLVISGNFNPVFRCKLVLFVLLTFSLFLSSSN